MPDVKEFVPGQWQRLSPWAIAHFAQQGIIQNLRVMIFGGVGVYVGTARSRDSELPWIVPLAIVALILIASTIAYIYYRYRVVDDAIQVRRGALRKQHLNLSFARIQNISIEHPFYFRPLGLVTLKIDGAGSKGEEVNIAALGLSRAQALRDFILRGKKLDSQAPATDDLSPPELQDLETEQPFFSRSVPDLILHGLTNNRAFIAIAAIFGFLAQSGLTPVEMAQSIGIDFDVVIGGLSLMRLTVLIVLSFIAAVGILALLSVLFSIFTYYGFTMYRTRDNITVRRGLLTRHEIHIKKSRIQTIHLRQDWLDRLLGRYNVILERISHSPGQGDPTGAQNRRILIPSVRAGETEIVIDEILPGRRPEELAFTPINFRYFRKRAAIVSVFYLAAVGTTLLLPNVPSWLPAVLLAAWPLHAMSLYLRWRAGGLAVDGDIVVARSGAIGIDYRLFAADKAQDITHIQSLLMRRHDLSSLRVNTASTTIGVPYLPTSLVRRVVDYCAFRVESTTRSWM
ncbi:MAG: PH domain-containing protein [Gammaproteobacteria bacterium]|jgi:putative membrane protein